MQQELLVEKYKELLKSSEEAIEHIDSKIAEGILKQLKKYYEPIERINFDDEIKTKILELKTNMQIVNFLAIDTKDAENIIKKHLLTFFKIDIPLEERIAARYNYIGYGEKNIERIALKKAILENEELIGNIPINEWIHKFENKDIEKKRSDDSFLAFILEDPDAKKLQEFEQSILKKIIHAYKKLLSLKLIDIYDVSASLREEGNSEYITNGYSEFNQNQSGNFLRKDVAGLPAKNIDISLSEALEKYPELGEQLITSYHIKLSTFPDPARPSIKNWLFDYTFIMGHNPHNSIERGSYLFQSENAKRLASPDRQKLAFILKAYDEDAQVSVNTNTKQIMFPKIGEQRTANNENFNHQHASQAPNNQNPDIPSAKFNFTHALESNEASKTVVQGFSSPQKMPFENQSGEPQPMRITPYGNLNRNANPAPKNVVNLKDQ